MGSVGNIEILGKTMLEWVSLSLCDMPFVCIDNNDELALPELIREARQRLPLHTRRCGISLHSPRLQLPHRNRLHPRQRRHCRVRDRAGTAQQKSEIINTSASSGRSSLSISFISFGLFILSSIFICTPREESYLSLFISQMTNSFRNSLSPPISSNSLTALSDSSVT